MELIKYKKKKWKNPNDIQYKNIFNKVKDGASEAQIIYQNSTIMAFRDLDEENYNLYPHIVISSNNKVNNLNNDCKNIGNVFRDLSIGVVVVAGILGVNEREYRLLMKNDKKNGVEDVIFYIVMDLSYIQNKEDNIGKNKYENNNYNENSENSINSINSEDSEDSINSESSNSIYYDSTDTNREETNSYIESSNSGESITFL
jgi:hypothetical protein